MQQPHHIQNFSDGGTIEPHWGYENRILPCKNDAGSCAYLDVVYRAHDLGMFYMGILWATILTVLLLWALLRRASRPVVAVEAQGTRQRSASGAGAGAEPGVKVGTDNHGRGFTKLRRTAAAASRHLLLRDANHVLFGRTTRLQVVVLALLAAYLLVWSFVGITYKTWVTPVKNMPGVYNTRTSLGPWSDRVGVLAYALTPLSVMLSSRESLLTVLTGVPYQSFNFLHRWLGYIVFVQAALHTIGWCVIEGRLYQPQPQVGIEWITEPYIIWGVVAMILLLLLFLLSTPWGIRLTGYEFFRKAHYVLAMVYIGACWAHWNKLECFLIPAFLLWGIDRAARLVRTAMLHYHPARSSASAIFKPVPATVTSFPGSSGPGHGHGDVLRLDLENEQDAWKVGQHFYLCFAESSIWQSHPFTPLNAPVVEGGLVKHSYIIRAKSGETKKVAELVRKKKKMMMMSPGSGVESKPVSTPVFLTGGYGEDLLEKLDQDTNIVCVAGGTGIAYVLPLLLQLASHAAAAGGPSPTDRRVQLIWAIRHARDVDWVAKEMVILRRCQGALNLTISLFATRDMAASDSSEKLPGHGDGDDDGQPGQMTDARSSSSGDVCPCGPKAVCPPGLPVDKTGNGPTDAARHPDLKRLVGGFVASTVSGRTVVFASGPGGMITDLREIVGGLNAPARVWKRQERYDVELVCDDRLEW
ncbi:hypothetical protein E4U43_005799 [Claviceps pusilla]|uniref:FAD-binding FR-type domain-containing protein n=1 Tax=Claviceps pusilla TaxID=123648 RepID=A0A9P7N4F4_9HYPO|nr:hypothetical protein E4U43_005799 [Claviceps pusilla]